jgi:hypothetical protein
MIVSPARAGPALGMASLGIRHRTAPYVAAGLSCCSCNFSAPGIAFRDRRGGVPRILRPGFTGKAADFHACTLYPRTFVLFSDYLFTHLTTQNHRYRRKFIVS